LTIEANQVAMSGVPSSWYNWRLKILKLLFILFPVFIHQRRTSWLAKLKSRR